MIVAIVKFTFLQSEGKGRKLPCSIQFCSCQGYRKISGPETPFLCSGLNNLMTREFKTLFPEVYLAVVLSIIHTSICLRFYPKSQVEYEKTNAAFLFPYIILIRLKEIPLRFIYRRVDIRSFFYTEQRSLSYDKGHD